ncbi:MAG: T9SS type A sorting domain-containing protein [Bacteroidetes bacterium]|nr:T9SS type A sorting domain-containing protein [Bacteroidota bacterium]
MSRISLLIIGILLCLGSAAQIQINGSYLNTTRPNGGPIAVGDVIELRAVISVSSGTTITNFSYTDNVPTGTSFVSGSLKVVTNENQVLGTITNTGNYTDASNDDRGQIVGSAIIIYMGDGATKNAGGSVTGGTTKPVFQSGASIFMVAYQVTVTASYGSTITTAGVFHYRTTSNQNVNVPASSLAVSPYYACGSTIGSNLVTTETNGTFGSGTALNRGSAASGVTGFTFTNLAANSPVDGQYSVANSTSPGSSTKVFGVWDIMGDHSGTTTGAGNAPPTGGASGGYLLVVNATFAPNTIFTTNITGLVANNTYTISLWMRNICPTCGNNPVDGTATTGAGVSPNVSISLNSKSYYSSGNVAYTGQWVQKSFTFQNGSSTSATFEIKNNAPGGGGNDWALDDITMQQCGMVLPLGLQSFSGRSTANGNTLDWKIAPTPELRSFTIERSTDGVNFLPIGEVAANPNGSDYRYTDALLASPGSTVYYRIQLVSVDGTTNYSSIVSLQTEPGGSVLTTRLTPNPAHDHTTLAVYTPRAGSATVTLLDPTGIPILTKQAALTTGTNAIDFDLPSRLRAGIYIVRTISGNQTSISRLIVAPN